MVATTGTCRPDLAPRPATLRCLILKTNINNKVWKKNIFVFYISKSAYNSWSKKPPMCQWVFRLAKMIYSNTIKIRCLEVCLLIQTCLIIIAIYNKWSCITWFILLQLINHIRQHVKRDWNKITVVHGCRQKFWWVPKIIPHHKKNLASRIHAVALEEDIGRS